uniref:AAA+ ATPase domain-containing protein n=1 Tax=Arcella intermedia TaxID=1963864 RepID=A0A6B2L0Z6_9EUKA
MSNAKKQKVSNEAEMWVDKYKPKDPGTLCVAKKKYQSVVDAITSAVKDELRLIILLGPPGTGKTATIELIAQYTNMELVQWVNPPNVTYLDAEEKNRCYIEGEKSLTPFLNFIQREKYPSLGLDFQSSNRRKIVLVEDIPNFHTRKQRLEFQRTILTNVVTARRAFPCVFIISDETEGKSNVNQIFSTDILENSKVTSIRFNPVTPTMMKKTLQLILEKEKAMDRIDSKTFANIIESSGGDVRTAINMIQMLALQENVPAHKKAGQKKPKGKNVEPLCLGSRDFSLSLFHSLGKVLYNKRNEGGPGGLDQQFNMKQIHHRSTMKSDPSVFYKDIHVDSTIFNQFLAENYLKFFTDIEDISLGSKYISDSDIIVSSKVWNSFQDEVIVSEYAWETISRGLMYSNTHPSPNKFTPLVKPHNMTIFQSAQNNSMILYNLHKSFCLNYLETPNILCTQVLPYYVHLTKKFNFGLTATQLSFMRVMTSYSSPKQESLAVRGGEVLQQFDTYFEDYKKIQVENERRNTITNNIDNERIKKETMEMLKEDDIEEC